MATINDVNEALSGVNSQLGSVEERYGRAPGTLQRLSPLPVVDPTMVPAGTGMYANNAGMTASSNPSGSPLTGAGQGNYSATSSSDYFSRIYGPYSGQAKSAMDALTNLGGAPDEASIRESRRKEAQSAADLIREQYNRIIGEDRAAGEVRSQRGRALNVSGGLQGSDFASARAQGIDDQNLKIIQERERERDAEINKIMAAAEGRATADFQSARDAYLTQAGNSLEAISKFNDKQREIAISDIKSVAGLGLTADEFKGKYPDRYDQLLKEYGGDEALFQYQFATNAPQATKIGDTTVGNKKIFFFQDPVTGAVKSQSIDLPETLSASEDIVNDAYGNPIVVTYSGEKGKSKITGTRMLGEGITKTGTGSGGGGTNTGGYTAQELRKLREAGLSGDNISASDEYLYGGKTVGAKIGPDQIKLLASTLLTMLAEKGKTSSTQPFATVNDINGNITGSGVYDINGKKVKLTSQQRDALLAEVDAQNLNNVEDKRGFFSRAAANTKALIGL